ncbi:hypothetical protein TWF694_005839 [Orbilia ellipsospora]|uniref:CHAT domain-containing protein n=1 Tax=Orbilia ellipsospora TaxID=2528407 RepID=A0AAV9WT78_9PEZI
MALIMTPQANHNLSMALETQFKQTGSIKHLNRAVKGARMVAQSVPQGHPERPKYLDHFARLLRIRCERTHSMNDLNGAIEAARFAIQASLSNDPRKFIRLSCLGGLLGTRFNLAGSMDDLNQSLEIAQTVINIAPLDHPDRDLFLSNLATCLSERFGLTGSLDDLNRTIEAAQQVVDTTAWDNPNRALYLYNLSAHLGARCDHSGSLDDINRAVEITRILINMTTRDDQKRAMHLDCLGCQLGRRFLLVGSIEDLNQAIEAGDMAVKITPQDHPKRAQYMSNLAGNITTRFLRTGHTNDAEVDRAIKFQSMSTDLVHQDTADRAIHLTKLANHLGTLFDRTGSISDLDRAIEVAGRSVDIIAQDSRHRATCLGNLAVLLYKRYMQTKSVDDLDRILFASKDGWHCEASPPSERIKHAEQVANILVVRSPPEWEEASCFMEKAIKLLPIASSRMLKHGDKQLMLANFSGLASKAAVFSLNSGKDAYNVLRLLELGLGVIANLLMEMRGDISELRERHPDLADEFVSLRDTLDLPVDTKANDALSSDSQPEIRYKLDKTFNKLLATIRAQPGFDNFLLPPTETEIKDAAIFGPIVTINVSKYRCDAFLVKNDGIRLLELPGLTLEDIEKHVRNLRMSPGPHPDASFPRCFPVTDTLEWLWDVVCHPVLDALGFKESIKDDRWPRVWWIPTGLLSQLPLHAAGYHKEGSTETVIDRVMSSYASSIKALVYGRRYQVRDSAEPGTEDDALVVVPMKHTLGLPGNQILPFVEAEAEMLTGLCPSLRLKSVTPALRKDDVLRHLGTRSCRMFHFAGHGSSHPTDPSQSFLLLEDWETNPLTVGDIRDCKFQENPPFLCYLSACLTGVSEAEKLADEGINLISAFQVAGFRHVIGTLWEVSDKHCVDVARVFYETIRDEGIADETVCRALHRAVRALRDTEIEEVFKKRNGKLLRVKEHLDVRWAPYIHFGV